MTTRPLRVRFLAPLALVPVLLAGDCTAPEDDDDDVTEQQSDWTTVDEGLPGALISVWGRDSQDVYVAGAQAQARHWDGTSWTNLQPPTDRDLWWVFCDGSSDVWFVGDAGTVLRYDEETSGWTEIDTPTTEGTTLFGAWGPAGGPVFAVGGNPGSSTEGPVLLRIEDGVATQVVHPALDVPASESFFKLWGTSEQQMWMISDGGSVFHFDGVDWARVVLPDSPRLVTIRGATEDDIVIVGGATQPVIYSRDGPGWDDVTPPGGSSLNGVYVDEAGRAWAAGSSNAVARRDEGGWTWVLPPLVLLDWHAVWLDEHGDPWLAGGNLIDLIDGAVVRYAPAQ